jgi:hypothetical protein
MISTRSIFARDGVGVRVGVNVGAGVKVAVGGIVGMLVEDGVSATVSITLEAGAGAKESPHKFGAEPQPATRTAIRKRINRFSVRLLQRLFWHDSKPSLESSNCQTTRLRNYFNIGILMP